jgi:hypothetical protein
MENLIAFLGLGSLVGLSMMFALWLEWMSLRVLLDRMPGRRRERQASPVAVEVGGPMAADVRSPGERVVRPAPRAA